MLELHIGNVLTTIEGDLPGFLAIQIKECCAYSIQGAEFSSYGSANYCPICKKITDKLTWEEKSACPNDGQTYRRCPIHGIVRAIPLWDGRKFLYDTRAARFPTGIIGRVIKVLKDNNIEYKQIDERLAPYTRRLTWYGPQLRYYQKDAVQTLIKRSRGIIHGATAIGKSMIISYFISETGVNTLILTHTAAVFHQMYETLKKTLKIPIGRVGDGYNDIAKVTVAMPQSLVTTVKVPKKKLVKGTWKVVNTSQQVIKEDMKDFLLNTESLLVDEAHRVACDTVQLVANSCVNAFFRVGVTATPYRADLLDILIESVTGKVNYRYTASQGIRDGYLSKPHIHLVNFKQSPYPRKKEVIDEKTGDVKTQPVKYIDLYTDRVIRNARRNTLISTIAYNHFMKHESVLIIVRNIEHGENLYAQLKYLGDTVRWVNGENNTKELQQVLKDLNDGTCRICIASGIFNEGIDVTGLNVCINTTACDSPVTAMQILGRTLRRTTTKTKVDFYDIYDTGVRWLGEHAVNREAMYSTEEEFIITHEDEKNYLQK